ncbi:MAG: hypothetical protein N3E51_02470 [Candidatus Micrarchaeota archaeon]|nr:hypothetical protein [Candidatus Micrarchaeota archaeon]
MAGKRKKAPAKLEFFGEDDKKLDLWFLLILGGIGLLYAVGFMQLDEISAKYFSYIWPVLVIAVALVRLIGSK